MWMCSGLRVLCGSFITVTRWWCRGDDLSPSPCQHAQVPLASSVPVTYNQRHSLATALSSEDDQSKQSRELWSWSLHKSRLWIHFHPLDSHYKIIPYAQMIAYYFVYSIKKQPFVQCCDYIYLNGNEPSFRDIWCGKDPLFSCVCVCVCVHLIYSMQWENGIHTIESFVTRL